MSGILELIKNAIISFFSTGGVVGPIDILINMLLAAIMSWLVYTVYIKYGHALSNRKQFGKSFLLITICTCIIIALIRSSIALSLGLVGALSIIRFRTAIKEPEELTYIFLCIAIGLGFGANERLITISAAMFALLILIIRGVASDKKVDNTYNLTIRSKSMKLDDIVALAKKYCKRLDLTRFDRAENALTVMLFAEFTDYDKLQECLSAFEEKDENINVNFMTVK